MELTTCANKRRYRTRERGAAVFVVTLAIVLLTGLGLWSMQWAALVDQASGNSRLARQTRFVAELGLISTTAYLSVPGWGSSQYNSGLTKPDPCEATMNSPVVGRFCRSIAMSDISSATSSATGNSVIDPGSSSAVGSLGGFSTGQGGLQGRFSVEMSDPTRAVVAGSDITKSQYFRVTLTARGEVSPPLADVTKFCGTSTNSVASRSGMRAHTIIGPI